MPRQVFPRRLIDRLFRHADRLAVERVILPAVVEILFDAAADLESKFRRDRHVAAVEQRVQVAADEDAVVGLVGSLFGEGFYVGGVEDGQDLLSRHRAPAAVGVDYDHAEDALAEARQDFHRRAVFFYRRFEYG